MRGRWSRSSGAEFYCTYYVMLEIRNGGGANFMFVRNVLE